METRKIIFIALAGVLSLLAIIPTACRKEHDRPGEKEKYAWVTGKPDSTGYGTVLFTADAGETWERQGLGTPEFSGTDFLEVWAEDKDNVWVTGTGNTLLRTSDGGRTWVKVQVPEDIAGVDLDPIYVVDRQTVWVGGRTATTGIIYKSEDHGATWFRLDTTFFHRNGIQGLWAVDPEKIYVVGPHQLAGSSNLRGFIGYTADGGATWDSLTPADNFNKWEWIGVVSSGSTLVIYGGKSHYMVSTDAGGTWKNDSIVGAGGVDGADINDLIMLGPETWWAAMDNGNIFYTADGGTSWTKQPNASAGGSFMVGIDTWDDRTALCVGSAFYHPPISPILKTVDGGQSWEKKFEWSVQLWKVSFIK